MKQPHRPLAYLNAELEHLEREGLRRFPPPPIPPDAISFCSNDYLGLARRPARSAAPTGAGASRLIAGERIEHRDAEHAFAAFVGAEDALLFSSGYAANVGLLSALARPGDLVVSDALNHASIIDGARLSRADVAVVPHLDVEAFRTALTRPRPAGRRAWVVVESYFSMDADSPDIATLRGLCDEHHAALIVDEAHALGVLGPDGRGLCAGAGTKADVLVGTLGKAFGGQGAFVAGPRQLRDWLWNRARSFVFSTGLAPASAAAATEALEHVARHPQERERVLALAEGLRATVLRGGARRWSPDLDPSHGAPLVMGHGHIVPIVVGTEARALALAERVCARGIAVQAIRPPTVPRGTARIRLTITATHTEHDVRCAGEAIVAAIAELETGARPAATPARASASCEERPTS